MAYSVSYNTDELSADEGAGHAIATKDIVGRKHERPHIGANGVSWPPGKMDEKLKSENIQKEQFSVFMLYFESNQGRQV